MTNRYVERYKELRCDDYDDEDMDQVFIQVAKEIAFSGGESSISDLQHISTAHMEDIANFIIKVGRDMQNDGIK